MFIKTWQMRMGDQISNPGFATRSSLDMGKLLQLLLPKILRRFPESLGYNGKTFTRPVRPYIAWILPVSSAPAPSLLPL